MVIPYVNLFYKNKVILLHYDTIMGNANLHNLSIAVHTTEQRLRNAWPYS
jgi:hypothetical protein